MLFKERFGRQQLEAYSAKDRVGTQVEGFIGTQPFLNNSHFEFHNASIGESYVGDKKGKSTIVIPLTMEAQVLLEEYTSNYLRERIAIFVNETFIVAPVIVGTFKGPLTIEGGYSEDEAQEILEALKTK